MGVQTISLSCPTCGNASNLPSRVGHLLAQMRIWGYLMDGFARFC
jgi:hypothetical protein